MKSMLGHLAHHFTIQTENLATEGLTYLLKESEICNNSLIRIIKTIDSNITGKMSFQNQVSDQDKVFPDIVGFSNEHKTVCIVEAKFWAGLTDNQPFAYLDRLSPTEPNILLFLCPDKRIPSLWNELLQLLTLRNTPFQQHSLQIDGCEMVKISDNQTLAITSWRKVLQGMKTDLQEQGDHLFLSDVEQLQGLCDKMDMEAFLPLHTHEFSTIIARRNMNFIDLIEEVIQKGFHAGSYSTKNLAQSSSKYQYGKYFKTGNYYCALNLDYFKWANLHPTPIWLIVLGNEGKKNKSESNRVRNAMTQWENGKPKRMFYFDGVCQFPLYLPLGVEKHHVINSILLQIAHIQNELDLQII